MCRRNAFGWDLRLTNVTSGDPQLVIRRDALPDGLSTHTDTGGYWYSYSPPVGPLAPSGAQAMIGPVTTYDTKGSNIVRQDARRWAWAIRSRPALTMWA